MDLATVALRFEDVRWNKTRDAFIVSCPNHSAVNAIFTTEGMKCGAGCALTALDIQFAVGSASEPVVAPAKATSNSHVVPQVSLHEWRGRIAQYLNDVIGIDPELQKPMLDPSWAINELVQGALMLVSKGSHPELEPPGALQPAEMERELGLAAEAALEVWKEQQSTPVENLTDEIWEGRLVADAANQLYLQRVPIIDRLCYSESTSLLVGPKHGGKTTNVRTVALSVARGEPIWDRVTTKGHVIYAASADEVASTRMQLLQMGWNDDDPLLLVHESPQANPKPGTMLDAIAKKALECRTVLIILDMLFDFAPIRDEMSYAGTRLAIQAVQHLADITKAHVMATHHSPKYMLDTATAATAALGSQGIAARFSPIILARKWADELFSIESTMTRDPRGAEIPQSVIEIDERGWSVTRGLFKEGMKWKMYAKRIREHMEAGEPGTNYTVGRLAQELDIDRARVQNTLYNLFKEGQIDRIKVGRNFKYFCATVDNSAPEQFDRNGE